MSPQTFRALLEERLDKYRTEVLSTTGLREIPAESEWLLNKVRAYYLDLSQQGAITWREFERFGRSRSRGNKMLDYGCGAGGLAKVFAEHGYEVVGVDPDEESIKLALGREYPKNVSFSVLSGNKLPFPDRSFDLITSKSVLEHVDNKEAYIDEALRVLKDDGLLYIAYVCNKWFYLEHHSWLPIYRCRKGRAETIRRIYHFNPYWNITPQSYTEMAKMLSARDIRWSAIPGRMIIGTSLVARVLNKLLGVVLGSLGVSKYVASGWIVIIEKSNARTGDQRVP